MVWVEFYVFGYFEVDCQSCGVSILSRIVWHQKYEILLLFGGGDGGDIGGRTVCAKCCFFFIIFVRVSIGLDILQNWIALMYILQRYALVAYSNDRQKELMPNMLAPILLWVVLGNEEEEEEEGTKRRETEMNKS